MSSSIFNGRTDNSCLITSGSVFPFKFSKLKSSNKSTGSVSSFDTAVVVMVLGVISSVTSEVFCSVSFCSGLFCPQLTMLNIIINNATHLIFALYILFLNPPPTRFFKSLLPYVFLQHPLYRNTNSFILFLTLCKRQCHTQWIFQFLILKINKVSQFQNNASYFFPGMYLLHFSNSGFCYFFFGNCISRIFIIRK